MDRHTPETESGKPDAADPVVLGSRTIHRGAKFDYVELTVRHQSGRVRERQIVRHPGAIVVVPLLDDGRIVMIRTFRISVARWLWECCAGTRENGEEPRECALRELEEETGYRATSIEPLGDYYTSTGLSDELMHAFVARGLEQVGQNLEADESIRVEVIEADRLFAMIDAGELMDGKSMLALLLARRQGLIAGTSEQSGRGGRA